MSDFEKYHQALEQAIKVINTATTVFELMSLDLAELNHKTSELQSDLNRCHMALGKILAYPASGTPAHENGGDVYFEILNKRGKQNVEKRFYDLSQ